MSENPTTSIRFESKAGYALVTGPTGHVEIVLVKKTEGLNPSARGGAYRTEWVARARGRKFHADTRKAAVEQAIVSLRERGFAV